MIIVIIVITVIIVIIEIIEIIVIIVLKNINHKNKMQRNVQCAMIIQLTIQPVWSYLTEPAWLRDSQPRMATPLRLENFGRIDFSLGRWIIKGKKSPSRRHHMPRYQENLSEFFSDHYCGHGSHFPESHLEISKASLTFVLKEKTSPNQI